MKEDTGRKREIYREGNERDRERESEKEIDIEIDRDCVCEREGGRDKRRVREKKSDI